jgi:predicted RNA-binding Zn ribbon-like protein
MLSGMTVTRWSWLGDPLAIDLANTVRRRGWRYHELITSPAELHAWLDHERGRLTIPAEVDSVLLTRFLAIRDPVLGVLRAAAIGAALPPADVTAVNDQAAAAPVIRLLGSRPGRSVTQPVIRADPVTRLCADLAAAAIDLLTGPDAAAVALCDAPGCGQLYRRSRPNQQWCDPHCGTRARSRRHLDRRVPPPGPFGQKLIPLSRTSVAASPQVKPLPHARPRQYGLRNTQACAMSLESFHGAVPLSVTVRRFSPPRPAEPARHAAGKRKSRVTRRANLAKYRVIAYGPAACHSRYQ